jgi:hypothetical protein
MRDAIAFICCDTQQQSLDIEKPVDIAQRIAFERAITIKT